QRHALSLAADRAGNHPQLPGDQRLDGRGRDHGCSPPRALARGNPVSSRIDSHNRRQGSAAQLFGHELVKGGNGMDIRAPIDRLVSGEHLSEAEMEAVVDEIMTGRATTAQIGAFLVALRMVGETVQEIAGAARALRRSATPVSSAREVLDTCGTGGD